MLYNRNSACRRRSPLRCSACRPLLLSIIVAAMAAGLFPSGAEAASIADKIKSWFELPSQVDELKSQYEGTKQQLEDAARQIDEAARQSQESLEQYRQAEQRLREDNERLAKQNEQLGEAIKALQAAEQQRESRSRRTWTVVWTAIGLVALYFLSSRLFRVLIRSRRL